jgi:hypothetical protein
MHIWRLFIACSILSLGSLQAAAQTTSPVPGRDEIARSQAYIFGSSAEASLAAPVQRVRGDARKITTFMPSAQVNSAAQLASVYPAAGRAQAQLLFTQLLQTFRQAEVQYKLPTNDVPNGVAMFLMGAHTGFRGKDMDDSAFVPLVEQLRAIMVASPQFAKISDAEKQQLYEQMAIIGMFVSGTYYALQKKPDAQLEKSMVAAGANYLRSFLGVEPARINFTGQGLVLNDAAMAPDAEKVSSMAQPQPASKVAKNKLASVTSSLAMRAVDGIDTVGFYTKTGFGYGGMLTFNPTPVVLFRSGEALLDMEALKFGAGLSAHKQANPDDWTKWRRSGAAIELLKAKGWERITYTKTIGRLPRGFKLSGNYRSSSGAGNMAVGGSAGVVAWSNIRFDASGNFGSDGGAGSSNANVTTMSRSDRGAGRYDINGYTLTLYYADGRIEQRMIVAEAGDTKAIWLDGQGYVLRN